MMKHLRYARYLLLHKWYVLLAGLKTHAPAWRLVIHDWSKLLPSEWFPYAETFFGKKDVQGFKAAWLRHQNRNPHHWNYWVLRGNGGTAEPLEMPEGYVREMVADWAGAGRAKSGGDWTPHELAEWYAANAPGMVMHPKTRELVSVVMRQYMDRMGTPYDFA